MDIRDSLNAQPGGCTTGRCIMRSTFASLVCLTCVLSVVAKAQTDANAIKRYGIEANLDAYPQGTPKETLASVLLAIEKSRVDYLLAQLTDPKWVDDRVKQVGGKFDNLVKETSTKLSENPGAIKELRQFLTEGEWQVADETASAKLKGKDRRVFCRKVEGRWFFEDRKN